MNKTYFSSLGTQILEHKICLLIHWVICELVKGRKLCSILFSLVMGLVYGKMTFNMLAEARNSSDGQETVPKAGRAPSSWGGPIMIDQFPRYPWLATFYRK